MKGYIYILNGKVVINPEVKPEDMPFIISHFPKDESFNNYEVALKEWRIGCVEVDNMARYPCNKGVWYWGGAWCFQPTSTATKEFVITDGSQVEHDGPIITKII